MERGEVVRDFVRQSNETIARVARETSLDAPVPFICECGDPFQDGCCTTRTDTDVWVTTAVVTLPSRCPTSPLRRWEPSTIRLALRSSAVSMIPFQVGTASTAMLCDRNPAVSASEAR